MFGNELFRQGDDVLRLCAKQPDGFDVVAQRAFTECDHLFRRVGDREQRWRGLVHPGIGRLCRKHHRHQQRVGIDVREFAARFGIGVREAAERLFDLSRTPRLGRYRHGSRLLDRGAGHDARIVASHDPRQWPRPRTPIVFGAADAAPLARRSPIYRTANVHEHAMIRSSEFKVCKVSAWTGSRNGRSTCCR